MFTILLHQPHTWEQRQNELQNTEAVRVITEQLELAQAMTDAGITTPSENHAIS